MKVFARIIDLPETQCLLTVEYDDEEDGYKMNVTMDFGGVRSTMGYGFHEEEQAFNCMEKYSVDDAINVYDAVKAMLAEA